MLQIHRGSEAPVLLAVVSSSSVDWGMAISIESASHADVQQLELFWASPSVPEKPEGGLEKGEKGTPQLTHPHRQCCWPCHGLANAPHLWTWNIGRLEKDVTNANAPSDA